MGTSSIYEEIYSILDNQTFLKEGPTIYHYTSIKTLHDILKSKSLHLTHIGFMNDYSEYDYGLKMFEEQIKEWGKSEYSDAAVGFIRKIQDMKDTCKICIGSFTSLKDSLSQWRSYAMSSKGIAIGLDSSKIKTFCESHHIAFGGCVYSGGFKTVFVKFIERIRPYVNNVKDINNPEEIKRFNMTIVAYLIITSSFIKHNGFSEEKEVRIVAGSEEHLPNKLSNKLYVPYYNLDFKDELAGIIKEVWIGPAADQELVKRSIKLLLNEYSIDAAIYTSSIPYRLLGE